MEYSNATTDESVDVGIVVPAVDMTPDIPARLVNSISEHESTRASWRVVVVDRDDADAARFGRGANFNLAAAKNSGIRELVGRARIIACTDADYIIPAGLIDYLAAETGDRHVWIGRRDVPPDEIESRRWGRWMDLPVRRQCKGSFNAMSADNWRRIGGWDERCIGYGGEDDILHARIAAAGIERRDVFEFPLIHVFHVRTERSFSRANYRGEINLRNAAGDQPNYIDSPPPIPAPPTLADGLTFAVLTRDRIDLLSRTIESFFRCCDKEDIARITTRTIYDHASPPAVRDAIVRRYADFEIVPLSSDLQYHEARNAMLNDIDTPYALLWEDDWLTKRGGPMISRAFDILSDRPSTKCVTYRYWPAPVIRSQTPGGQTFLYRLHDPLGRPTGPKNYQNYYESHWGNFAWNPSLHDMAAVRSSLPVDSRGERGMAKRHLAAGYDMAYTLVGHVEHIGEVSALGKTRTVPNVKGAADVKV